MYALIGAEGDDPSTFFVAEPGQTFTARTSRELLFFANDWPGRYHNNHGCLDVTVERVRP